QKLFTGRRAECPCNGLLSFEGKEMVRFMNILTIFAGIVLLVIIAVVVIVAAVSGATAAVVADEEDGEDE
ncbi:MAG: hypothetical protein MSA09_13870, partial [Lachnospiraceae bacterium]|nr:hypothetical protein [Lachnospiraceae bacterium]